MPPRRTPSGFGPRSNVAVFPQFPHAARENRLDRDFELSTATDNGGNDEPSTLDRIVPVEPVDPVDRAPSTLPLDRAPSTLPLGQAHEVRRPAPTAIAFDDETQARPVDDHLLDRLRREDAAKTKADFAVDYEALPSLEVRRPFDTYEAEFSERDPATLLHGARESARVRRRKEASYREEPVAQDAQDAQNDKDVLGRREESGPRERPLPPAPRSYAAPVLEQPLIPPAPRVPEEMHSSFVVGVQPIRTATPDAWGTPHALPAQPSYQPQYAQYSQHPQYQHAGPQQTAPMPMRPSGMSPSAASTSQRAQPVGGQLAQPAPPSTIGRFAWFVAGAAFGITFAFFATGFFNAAGRQSNDFPAAAPLTTAAAPSTPAPAITAPPVAQPVANALPVPAPNTPGALPVVPPAGTAGASITASAPAASPATVRPSPRAPRLQSPRRSPPPASQVPKNLGGGGPGADDERGAPPSSSPAAELGDLLGAGLKP